MTSYNLRLDIFLKTAAVVSRDHPVVISKYITGAKEVEMDAIGNEGELVNYAIAEHIENAGVHSVEDLRREGGKTQCQTQMWKLPLSSLDPVLFIFIRFIRSLSRFNLCFLQRVGYDFLPVPSECHVPCAGRAIQHPVHLQGQRSQGH